jgi:hypothetical protein
MNIGDIVVVVGTKSVPLSLLGCYGIVTSSDDYKVMVKFKASVMGLGSLSHTALVTDLEKVGETNCK